MVVRTVWRRNRPEEDPLPSQRRSLTTSASGKRSGNWRVTNNLSGTALAAVASLRCTFYVPGVAVKESLAAWVRANRWKTELTHGVCASHKEQLLESIPSRSFPDVELLIVVRRNYIELYEHLQRWVVGSPGVQVLGERRATDRRSATCPVTDERRRVRTPRIRRGTISPHGSYTVVRFTPRVSHSS
jgi:hypothetical protein